MPACSVVSQLISKRRRSPSRTNAIIPPSAQNPAASPTVSTGRPLSAFRMSASAESRQAADEQQMNTCGVIRVLYIPRLQRATTEQLAPCDVIDGAAEPFVSGDADDNGFGGVGEGCGRPLRKYCEVDEKRRFHLPLGRQFCIHAARRRCDEQCQKREPEVRLAAEHSLRFILIWRVNHAHHRARRLPAARTTAPRIPSANPCVLPARDLRARFCARQRTLSIAVCALAHDVRKARERLPI